MIPAVVAIDDPFIVQYFIVLPVASLANLIVDVSAAVEVLVLVIIMSFAAPLAFTLPSMVTLSAPFKSISGAAKLPLIVSPVIVG
jgi:hypothetical protein